MENADTDTLQLVSWIDRVRSQNKLHYGTKVMEDGTYTGELDASGKACGEGILRVQFTPHVCYWKSLWKEDKFCGLSIRISGKSHKIRMNAAAMTFEQTILEATR